MKKEYAEPMGAGYLELPVAVLLTNGHVRLYKTLEYYTALYKRLIVIEKGFVSDLLSVPWFARWLIPKDGEGRNEAIVHDKLCKDRPSWCDSKMAHRILEEALIASKIKKWKRVAISKAVWYCGPRWEKAVERIDNAGGA